MTKKTEVLIEQYAKSLVEVAVEKNCVTAVQEDVKALLLIFEESDLNKTLQSLAITREQKKQLVRLLQESSSDYMKNFLEVILQNEREGLLYSILEATLEKFAVVTQNYDAVVTTAIALSDKQKQQLVKTIETKFGLTVHQIIEKIDENILGGFIINVNNRIIDTSIRRQLQQFKMKLK